MTTATSPIQDLVDKYAADTVVWIKAVPLQHLTKDDKDSYLTALGKALKTL
jgi:hypothetical protein